MILLTAFMETKVKEYNKLSNSINVLFIIGYIIDFVDRKANLNFSLKFVSVLPFILSLLIIIFLLIKLLKYKNENEYNLKLSSLLIRLVLNITFLLLIFLL